MVIYTLHTTTFMLSLDWTKLVAIVTKPQAGLPNNRGSIPASGNKLISSTKRPDRLSGPLSILFNGHRPSLPRVKRPGREAEHSSHLAPRLRMERAVTPFPPTCLHGVHMDNPSLHFTSFYLTPSTTKITLFRTIELLWTAGTGAGNRSYTVPFMSYGTDLNICPIKRYTWKYEVEERHKITRQWTRTHLRH